MRTPRGLRRPSPGLGPSPGRPHSALGSGLISFPFDALGGWCLKNAPIAITRLALGSESLPILDGLEPGLVCGGVVSPPTAEV